MARPTLYNLMRKFDLFLMMAGMLPAAASAPAPAASRPTCRAGVAGRGQTAAGFPARSRTTESTGVFMYCKSTAFRRRLPLLPLLTAMTMLLAPPHALAQADAGRLQQALSAFDDGDFRTAEAQLKDLLQRDPGLAEARLLLGRTYLQLGDGAAAEKELQRAAELGVAPNRWRLDLAEALLQQRRFEDAVTSLEEQAAALANEPAAVRAAALGLRGRALLGMEQIDEARMAFTEARRLNPDDRLAGLGLAQVALLANDLAAAAATLDGLLARFPDESNLRLLRAEVFRGVNDPEAALEQYDQILARERDNLRALLGRATVRVSLQRFADARADLERIERLRPDVVVVHYLRGVMAFYERDWETAAGHLEEVLSVQPTHVQSMLLMGVVSYARNQLQLAEEYLSRILRAMPDNIQAAKVLAATRLKLREPARAVQVLEPFSETGDPQIMALLGSAYMLAGDPERGQQWLSQAVETTPDAAALRTQLALTLIAGGRMGEAIAELESAVDLGQDVLQADVLLVLALLREGKADEAIAASTALETRRPNSPIPANLTGLALLAQGRLEPARERFERALELDPRFTTALINLARVDVAGSDLEAAEARYRRVLDQEGGNLAALLGMAALAEQRDDPAALESWLTRAQDANPGATQPGLLLARFLIERGDYVKALGVARAHAARFPQNPEVLEMLGRAATLTGDTANATRTFAQVEELRPNDPRVSYLLGGAHWKAEDYRAAATAFRRAIELRPDYLEARLALASVLLAAEDYSAAVAIARALQADYPDNQLGHRLEGRILLAAREPRGAVAALEQALAMAPAGDTVRELADAHHRAGDDARAIELLRDWTAQQPADLDSLAFLALLLQGEGRDEEALPIYLDLYEQGTENVVILNNLAWILHQRGDPQALEIAAHAYEQAPNQPEIADTYGWILFNSGRRAEGLNILQQAHLAYPSQTEITYHVAVALQSVGRGDQAARLLQRLLRDHPGAPEAPRARALLERLRGAAGD
ncbi:MAG: PEP-CTERM system TPR-repeat protein PrsT [Chromatiaceae bacterium]|nr:MAG: PEP-CTERM system TPR-repeat protein PrsT [Chromatiaceae bacterium]